MDAALCPLNRLTNLTYIGGSALGFRTRDAADLAGGVKYHPKFPPFYHLKLPHLFPCCDLNCPFGPRQHKLAGFAQRAIRAAKRPVFFAACGGARYLFWLPSIIGLVTSYGLRAMASGSSTGSGSAGGSL